MELVSRYATKTYLFGLLLAVVLSTVFYGIFRLVSAFGRDEWYGMNVPSYFTMLTNAIFVICGGIAVCIGIFLLLAMLVQLSLLDIHENADIKLEKQKEVFACGVFMLVANLFVGASAWIVTYGAQNFGFGYPVLSEYVIGPVFMAALFAFIGAITWQLPPVRSAV